ncbi:(Dimethylallyl)adenosine tRNA methylthiotransferase miaB [Kibdelosporangium sp. 4NS15]|uniref:(Dimethylallyl)adenosine tRNA methylthiotransferase miaB n=2 Tax=Kibdelosporangium persicum TaxID=2698649 RepID=A0ABX2F9V1_9PSEU|nr:(Dimethylallyl)adenosine tRNA methylthiotransferase miaB [Kibdelosporangium persicum]
MCGPMTDVDHLRDQIDAVERKAIRTVDLGARAIVISVAVLVLLVGLLLPWLNGANGWQVLLGHVEGKAGVVPRLFAATAAGFGVLASMLALMTRLWALTWVCAIGGWFASVDGMLAIWSRQSTPEASPGIGLVIAVIAMVVIATCWFRTAWSRPDLDNNQRLSAD